MTKQVIRQWVSAGAGNAPQALDDVVNQFLMLWGQAQLMGRLILSAVFLFLVGCNTPGPDFRGLPAKRIDVDGSIFDVRVDGLQAEALRINLQYAPRFGPIRLRAATAMHWASGCRVVDVRGDQALAIGRLDCGDGPPPPRYVPLSLECVPVRGSAVQEIGQVRLDLDCDPA